MATIAKIIHLLKLTFHLSIRSCLIIIAIIDSMEISIATLTMEFEVSVGSNHIFLFATTIGN